MSGCRHQKSDLKPKHFVQGSKKKDLKPQISVCKSNNVTGATAPISRRQVTTRLFHAEFSSFLRFEQCLRTVHLWRKTKHFSQPDVQLFVWVSLPPIAAWLTSERFLTLMAKTPAICFCDVPCVFLKKKHLKPEHLCAKIKKKGSLLQDFVAWHDGCLFALAHIMHTCQLCAPLRQSHAERRRSNRCSDTDTQHAGANARHQSCNTHAYEHKYLTRTTHREKCQLCVHRDTRPESSVATPPEQICVNRHMEGEMLARHARACAAFR